MHREAIQKFMRVLELDPDNIDACRNIGVSYEKLGEIAEAKKWFEIAVEKRGGLGSDEAIAQPR